MCLRVCVSFRLEAEHGPAKPAVLALPKRAASDDLEVARPNQTTTSLLAFYHASNHPPSVAYPLLPRMLRQILHTNASRACRMSA